ncbi:MAG: alcohol dehydrogenase catalytic domain-containing protein [Candidatus Lokiarchaeota archaeon]|nr:alcohol dehydrogenase catalytic domain-containing protein [Candidatus Lokiarchaeota archaeon]
MRRVLIPEGNKAIIEIIDKPKLGYGEILLKVAYCGICGSDLHAFKGKHPFVPLPATPGHEFSGKISLIGEGVSEFEIGDRVTVEPSLVCNKCYNCKSGRYNICSELRVMGCQGDGAMADFIVIPANKAISLPDNLSLKHATLVEPLAVGVHAVTRGGNLLNKNIVVIGAGMIGLAVLICVVKAGAKRIIVTDLSDDRLEMAKNLGATSTINVSKINPVEKILSEQPHEGIDVVFECVGIEKSIRDAMDLLRKGGRVVVVGVFGNEVKINMANVQDREQEIIGSLMYTRSDFIKAIQMITNASFPLEMFITKTFPLEKVEEAFRAALDTKTNLKVTFEINKEN